MLEILLEIFFDKETVIKIRIYVLAVKYYIQGDEWEFAIEYATSLVKGWKK